MGATFEIVEMPRWKERCIYALLHLLGYKTADWMLLQNVEEETNA